MTIIREQIDPAKIQRKLEKDLIPQGTVFFDPDANSFEDGVVISPEGKVTHYVATSKYADGDYQTTLTSGQTIHFHEIAGWDIGKPPTLSEFLTEWTKLDPSEAKTTLEQLEKELRESSDEFRKKLMIDEAKRILQIAFIHTKTGESNDSEVMDNFERGLEAAGRRINTAVGAQRLLESMFSEGGKQSVRLEQFESFPPDLLNALAKYSTELKTAKYASSSNDTLPDHP